MKRVTPEAHWPQSWKDSYPYDLSEVYNEVTVRGYTYAYLNRRRYTLDMIKKVAKPGARILDVAAAQGNFTLALAEMGYDVTWNDLRAELADYVRLKHEKGTVHYAPGNAFELGFDSEFDVVLITEIIEHVAHPDEFLASVSALVKPGGHIVMSTPNGGYFLNNLPKFSECPDPSQFESMQFKPNSDGHIFLLHTDEIADLAQKAGIEVREIRVFTNTLTNGYLKTEMLLKVLPTGLVNGIEKLSCSLPGGLRRKWHTAMAVLFQRPA